MARTFNGSTQHGFVAAPFSTIAPLTFHCRARITDISTSPCLVSIGSTTATEVTRLRVRSTGETDARTQGGGGGGVSALVSGYTQGDTAYFGLTTTGNSSRRAWRNGFSSAAETSTRTQTALDKLSVAASYNGSATATEFAAVEIFEVAIWDVVLSDAQMESLAAGTAPDTVNSADLIHWWQLTGSANPEPDSAAGGSGLLIIGAPSGNPSYYYAQQAAAAGL